MIPLPIHTSAMEEVPVYQDMHYTKNRFFGLNGTVDIVINKFGCPRVVISKIV